MSVILELSLIAVLPVIASVVFFILEKRTAFSRLGYKQKQLLIGVVFGGIAVLGTEFGVDLGGAVANARDAAVLTAGLLFGAPAGIIAGLIGGIERFFAVYWGAGEYTQIACTISTVLAGVIGAVLRKFMFDDKKPSWLYAFGIGLVTEVLHMLMIFFTNMSDIQRAFTFVEQLSLPMITVNGLSVMLSVLAVTLISGEKHGGVKSGKKEKQITTEFQKGLLINVLLAFVITSGFALIIQNNISQNDTDSLLSGGISDVKADIDDASDANLLSLTKTIAAELKTEDNLPLLMEKYGVSEINVVDKNGIISDSTNADFVNYDMASGEQSAEFLVLLSGESEYVQEYMPTSYDAAIMRKYAGAVLQNGGFVQVGYDADRFQQDIAEGIITATQNRHIGKTGFLMIADEKRNFVGGTGGSVPTVTDMPENITEGVSFSAKVDGKTAFMMLGRTEGYYIVSVLPEEEALFSRDISVYVTVFTEIIVFVGLFILIYFLIKMLVINNIRKINNSLAKITGGDLSVTVDVRTNEEFASLSDDINSTVVTLKQYIAEAAARIDKELEFAKAIQHSALPSVFPPFPNRSDFDIYALMDTAKEVGGDFYDFYMTGQDKLTFLIADVSGKGIPAALFMMRAKTLIKSCAETGMSVDGVFTQANEKLCESNDAEMFVTGWLGKINLKTGEVTFANAGHNPPLVRHGGEGFEYLKSASGFVLAGMEGVRYRANLLKLAPGDTLFLYTDGVTEATNGNTELYGEDRLKAVLDGMREESAEEICRSVKAAVDGFVGEAPRFDDITMLCIKYKG